MTFTATVAGATAGSDADAAPAGSVEFLVNDEFGAQITVKVPIDSAGRATYNQSREKPGRHPLSKLVCGGLLRAASFD